MLQIRIEITGAGFALAIAHPGARRHLHRGDVPRAACDGLVHLATRHILAAADEGIGGRQLEQSGPHLREGVEGIAEGYVTRKSLRCGARLTLGVFAGQVTRVGEVCERREMSAFGGRLRSVDAAGVASHVDTFSRRATPVVRYGLQADTVTTRVLDAEKLGKLRPGDEPVLSRKQIGGQDESFFPIRLPVTVIRRDDDLLDVVLPARLHDPPTITKRDTSFAQVGEVIEPFEEQWVVPEQREDVFDEVEAPSSFEDPEHLDSGHVHLPRGDQQERAGAHEHGATAGLDQAALHLELRASHRHHARERPPRERGGPFVTARAQNHSTGIDRVGRLVVLQQGQPLVAMHRSEDLCIQSQVDAFGVFFQAGAQLRYAFLPLFLEVARLRARAQRSAVDDAAGPRVFVDHQAADSRLRKLHGGRDACRPCANDDDGVLFSVV